MRQTKSQELYASHGTIDITNQSEVILLEEELVSLKERLQITIEELETSNEELQSTNEELETSNEELQSTNEELQTVNDELSFKNRELEFAQKAFNNVLNSIKVDVLIVDSSLNIVKYTDGILKFFDISKTNFYNFSTILLNATVSLPNLLEDLKSILKDDKEIHYEVALGQKIYLFRVHKISMGLSLSSNEESGLVLSFLDRTEFFQKDRILFQQSKMASMGEMIGNIAHQWRQPLNVLGINIATLLEKINTDNLDKAFLDKFKTTYEREIVHMSSTIDDFRNFFEPTKEYATVSLTQVVNQAILMMVDSFRYNQINIDKELKRYQFYGSGNELAQVLLNIFTNSKDAFVSNSIQNRTVKVISFKKDNYVVLKVIDNAGGVDPKYLEHIEEPYFTTKKNQGGSGIGLYMSKMIIEQMGGKVEFHNNKEGNGLEVHIYLLNKKGH